jgi:hypothetical protein
MNNRYQAPSGVPGVLMIAVALAPFVIKKCKPAVVAVGKALVKAGTAIQKTAEHHAPA